MIEAGLWSIFFPVSAEDKDRLTAELWERGTTGILEESNGLRAFFGEEIDPAEVVGLGENSGPQIESDQTPISEVPDAEPVFAGERFFIVPAGSSLPTPPSRLRLEMDSAPAFGTGRHETTQLCLEALGLQALEKYFSPNFLVVDVGCGSGILSKAAYLLGARRIVSCDIDENAVFAAGRRLKTPLFAGSADAIADAQASLILANLTGAVLDNLAFDLKRILKPDGLLVISGFLREHPPQSFVPEIVMEQGDWLCWMCRRDAVTPVSEPAPEGLSHTAEWWL